MLFTSTTHHGQFDSRSGNAPRFILLGLCIFLYISVVDMEFTNDNAGIDQIDSRMFLSRIREHVEFANQLADSGKYRKATREYQNILRHRKQLPLDWQETLWYNLALCFKELGMHSPAIGAFNYTLNLIYLHHSSHLQEQAFKEKIQTLHVQLGEQYYDTTMWEQSARHFIAAAKLTNKNAELYYNAAQAILNTKSLNNTYFAVDALKKSVKQNPRNFTYQASLGVALSLIGNIEEASQVLNELLQHPLTPQLHIYIAFSVDEKNSDDAISHLEQYISLVNDSINNRDHQKTSAYYRLGRLYKNAGRVDDEMALYLRAVKEGVWHIPNQRPGYIFPHRQLTAIPWWPSLHTNPQEMVNEFQHLQFCNQKETFNHNVDDPHCTLKLDDNDISSTIFISAQTSPTSTPSSLPSLSSSSKKSRLLEFWEAVQLLEDNFHNIKQEFIKNQVLEIVPTGEGGSDDDNEIPRYNKEDSKTNDQKDLRVVADNENVADTGNWKQAIFARNGKKLPVNWLSFPTTASVLEKLLAGPSNKLPKGSMEFSVLSAFSHLRSHCGPTNHRIRLHLPIVIPIPQPTMRVVNDTRPWVEGKVTIFDDSFDHEVWNPSSDPRAVLLLDVWHPELNEQEREEIRHDFNWYNQTWWTQGSPWGINRHKDKKYNKENTIQNEQGKYNTKNKKKTQKNKYRKKKRKKNKHKQI